MPDPPEEFLAHAQLLQDYLGLSLSEADTRAYLIDPVLHAVGRQKSIPPRSRVR